MKRCIVFLAFVALAASSFTFAAGKHLSASIPFAFYVEDQLLPAGEYNFEMNDRLLMIRTKDGIGIGLYTMMNGAGESISEDMLLFNKYGNQYFLCGLATSNYQSTVRMAKIEKKIRAEFQSASVITWRAKKAA